MRVYQPGGHLSEERGGAVGDWSWRRTRRRIALHQAHDLADEQRVALGLRVDGVDDVVVGAHELCDGVAIERRERKDVGAARDLGDHVRRRGERHGRGDHLSAGLEVEAGERDMHRGRTGVQRQRPRRSQVSRKLLFEALRLGARGDPR